MHGKYQGIHTGSRNNVKYREVEIIHHDGTPKRYSIDDKCVALINEQVCPISELRLGADVQLSGNPVVQIKAYLEPGSNPNTAKRVHESAKKGYNQGPNDPNKRTETKQTQHLTGDEPPKPFSSEPEPSVISKDDVGILSLDNPNDDVQTLDNSELSFDSVEPVNQLESIEPSVKEESNFSQDVEPVSVNDKKYGKGRKRK